MKDFYSSRQSEQPKVEPYQEGSSLFNLSSSQESRYNSKEAYYEMVHKFQRKMSVAKVGMGVMNW